MAGPMQDTEVVRPPVLSRVIAGVVAVVGLLLLVNDLLQPRFEIDASVGVVFLVVGSASALARAELSSDGIRYHHLRRIVVARSEITAVRQAHRLGVWGVIPTLVVERRDKNDVALRGIAQFDTRRGSARMSELAAYWSALLDLPER